jgi:hypothetical protein
MANETAKKIVLGKRPKSFQRVITFPLPGEGIGSMEVDFKYRTRSELATFTDEIQAAIQADTQQAIESVRAAVAAGEKIKEPTQAELTARQDAFSVRYLMGAVDDWNLDVPFDHEAAQQLVDELPGAVAVIIGEYRAALMDGRLGN